MKGKIEDNYDLKDRRAARKTALSILETLYGRYAEKGLQLEEAGNIADTVIMNVGEEAISSRVPLLDFRKNLEEKLLSNDPNLAVEYINQVFGLEGNSAHVSLPEEGEPD